VLNTIYILFNEGYNFSPHREGRTGDLMGEALLFGKLLTENKHTRLPQSYALMALMCFHAARNESRFTTEGEIILLPYQDRKK